jgi:hypothetical protein
MAPLAPVPRRDSRPPTHEQSAHQRRLAAERPVGILRPPTLAERCWRALSAPEHALSRLSPFERALLLAALLGLLLLLLGGIPTLLELHRDLAAALPGAWR